MRFERIEILLKKQCYTSVTRYLVPSNFGTGQTKLLTNSFKDPLSLIGCGDNFLPRNSIRHGKTINLAL
jgi:hypothetical protein